MSIYKKILTLSYLLVLLLGVASFNFLAFLITLLGFSVVSYLIKRRYLNLPYNNQLILAISLLIVACIYQLLTEALIGYITNESFFIIAEYVMNGLRIIYFIIAIILYIIDLKKEGNKK